MKSKFRVEEKIYDDGRSRFFPQVGDWWHGWRYFSESSAWDSVSFMRVSFDSLDLANAYLERQRDAIEFFGMRPSPTIRRCVKSVFHDLKDKED